MKYTGMPSAMWMLYKKSFRNHLVSDLGFTDDDANRISKQSKQKYREIIEKLPEFEKADRFKTNIVNCAMLIAFLRCMDRRPTVEELTHFCENAMTMSELGGASDFVRKYTLASDGPYCDCGYKKRNLR